MGMMNMAMAVVTMMAKTALMAVTMMAVPAAMAAGVVVVKSRPRRAGSPPNPRIRASNLGLVWGRTWVGQSSN